MLLSRKFINQYVDIEDVSSEKLADVLTNAGLEVEGIQRLLDIENLKVGHVTRCEKMADSDHLHLCEVDVGEETLPIVCGADNVAKDQKVVVATEGAVLPGDFKIKKTQLRGEDSHGMICSLAELGIEEYFDEEQSEGIYVFDETVEVGEDARKALGFDDEVLDVKQTPNRSDFLSMFSIAYEIAALFERELRLPNLEMPELDEKKASISLSLETENASYFMARKIHKLEVKEAAKWMQEHLLASGIRPINNLVDISNYVMLETGQPLHFYDADKLEGNLSIRDDFEGEVIALDGQRYHLEKGDLVICDEKKPVGIAGVMGLENTMIDENTESIVVEIARFDRVRVRKTATRLGLSSEATTRFTKPMDPLAAQKAMLRLTSLLLEHASASGFEEIVEAGSIPYQAIEIEVKLEDLNRLLGTDFSQEEVLDVFERLHLEPKVKDQHIQVTVPSFRRDLSIPEDLAEEVIRILGYDRLPETLPKMDLTQGKLNDRQIFIRDLEKAMLAAGAHQIISYTLEGKKEVESEFALDEAIPLLSPLSDKRAYLRTALLPSMIKTAEYNVARQNKDFIFFEHSRIYAQEKRQTRLAILGHGYHYPKTWHTEGQNFDFFVLKGLFLDSMERLGIHQARFRFEGIKEDETSLLHPFRAAKIYFGRDFLGYMGDLHPKLAENYDLEDPVYLEINLDPLIEAKKGKIKAQRLSRKHAISRDIAILIDEHVPAEKIIQSIQRSSQRSLLDIELFDVFTSKELGQKRSLAFKLRFDGDKIDSSEEIASIMEAIEKQLKRDFQAEIR